MKKHKQLIIVGTSDLAQIAFEYFSKDSDYRVCGFSVEKAFINNGLLLGIPVVAFENIEECFSPSEYEVFVAIAYQQLNRLRTRLYHQAKQKGYRIASYISPHAFVWPKAKLGENVFIFENNTVQPFVEIGNNVVLWSGNHIGHHSVIRDNCFISSHVVISGHCDIGENCFFGVNSSIANNTKVAKDNFITMGTIINKDTEENKIYKNQNEPANIPATKFWKVRE